MSYNYIFFLIISTLVLILPSAEAHKKREGEDSWEEGAPSQKRTHVESRGTSREQEAELTRLKQLVQLQGPAILEVVDQRGETPALLAASQGQVEVLAYLVETAPSGPAILEVAAQSGATPALLAASHGHLHVLKYLVEVHPSGLELLRRENEHCIDGILEHGSWPEIEWLFSTFPTTLENREFLKARGYAALRNSQTRDRAVLEGLQALLGWPRGPILPLQDPVNRTRLEKMLQEAGVVPGLTEEMEMINSAIEIIQQLRASAERAVSGRGIAYRAVLDLVLQALGEPILKHTDLLLRKSRARGGV